MRISKFVRLGMLIVVSITLLVWGLAYLKGNDIFSRSDFYYVYYSRVDGLASSANIALNGYPIGKVREVEFAPDNSGRLLVTLAIDAEFKIPKNSVAQIVSSDIMGTRSVKLLMSDENQYHQPNDTILGAIESDLKEQVSLQVLPLKNKAEELLGTIDSAITVLTMILNEDAQENLSASFANINQTIKNIEATTADLEEIVAAEKSSIKSIISNVDEITTSFKSNTEVFESTLQNLYAFSDTLSERSVSPMLNNIETVSEQLVSTLEKLNSDESSAGLLLNDDELYNNINLLSENLAFLVKDIQTNPKRYLEFSAIDFGKDVYINTGEDISRKAIIFKVHLVSSKIRIDMNSDLFDGLGDVEEYYSGGTYSYLIGNTGVYSEIEEIHRKARKNFPDATIVAFKNGKLIKLEKALKSLN
jgi:phospholipid/cholesterol/gamma-HCH transport system substrate-binding protein